MRVGRWSWFDDFTRKAPCFSGMLIIAVGFYVAFHGYTGLAEHAASTTPAIAAEGAD